MTERFQLKLHRAAKEMPVCALVVGKEGPKFKASPHEAVESVRVGVNGRNQNITASKKSMDELAAVISNVFSVDRPVVNHTGLSGTYDFKIEATPEFRMTGDDPALKSVSIFAAIQQLGLKLEPQKAMIEVLVVDHVARPSTN